MSRTYTIVQCDFQNVEARWEPLGSMVTIGRGYYDVRNAGASVSMLHLDLGLSLLTFLNLLFAPPLRMSILERFKAASLKEPPVGSHLYKLGPTNQRTTNDQKGLCEASQIDKRHKTQNLDVRRPRLTRETVLCQITHTPPRATQ